VEARPHEIVNKSHIRPGALVFFDENRPGKLQPWDYFGIYSGNGYLIRASSYFGRVAESKMEVHTRLLGCEEDSALVSDPRAEASGC
jgi:hypothetical protein